MDSALQRNGWKSCSGGVATFSFAVDETKITACPVDDKGPGWISRIDGHQMVGHVQHTCGNLCALYSSPVLFNSPFLVGL